MHAEDQAEPVGTPSVEPGEPEGPPPGIEVMKVKGRAVSGIETDVPESVTQFDADTIAALGASNISDLAKVTPNVEIRSAGETTATFFIRGVGLSDFSSNAAGAVAIFQDDVQLNAPAIQLGQLFDVETVDLKRGPQGYGLFRNASAGAIRIYAKKPTGEYEAEVRQKLGSFWTDDARNAFIAETDGVLNVPLVEDTLASRIAFRVRRREPFMTNGCANAPPLDQRQQADPNGPPETTPEALSICGEQIPTGEISPIPPGLPKYVGDRSDWALRGFLRLSPPASDADFLLNVHGSRLSQDSTLGQVIGAQLVRPNPNKGQISIFGGRTNTQYWEPDQQKEYTEILFEEAGVKNQAEFDAIPDVNVKTAAIASAREKFGKVLAQERPLDRKPYRGDYDKIGLTTLDTIGGYLRSDFNVGGVADVVMTFGSEQYDRYRDSDIDFTPDVVIETLATDEAKQYTFDLATSGDIFDGTVKWNVGTSFLTERLSSLTYTDVGSPALPDPTRRRYVQDTAAYTTTASLSWDFLEDFTLEGGARWNYETKEFRIREVTFRGAGEIDRHRQETWKEPTGGISLRYALSDTSTVYAKYTRGYKVGHFNSNNGQELFTPGPARPEFIDSFEWGFQGAWIDQRILARGAFFFYKYKDYQVFIFRDNPGLEAPSLVIRNAQAVQQYGAELDLTLHPLKDWVPDEIDGLKTIVRFGWVKSQFLEFTNTVFRQDTQTLRTFPIVIDYGGNQLINAPEFKVSGTVEWPFDLGEWGTITPRYDFEWSDDIYFDPTEGKGSLDRFGVPIQPDYAVGQKAWWVHNVSLAYRTPVGNVEVRGWVRNVLDTRYKTFAFDASFFAQEVITFVADPRSAGVDVTITW